MSRRGATGLAGVLAIDKPAGMTSHDVVNRVRRITGERRVGHAGTLDPLATGLLLVGVGPATRLSSYLTARDKTYVARIVFGLSTDTDDADGRVMEVPSAHVLAERLELVGRLDAREVCGRLVGETEQLPPAYSAIKKGGVTAYAAARAGEALELETRTVTVHTCEFLGASTVTERLAVAAGEGMQGDVPGGGASVGDVHAGLSRNGDVFEGYVHEENAYDEGAYDETAQARAAGEESASAGSAGDGASVCGPAYAEMQLACWDVRLVVSKGTYVRSIARDLGAAIGCGAHVGALRREAVGGFDVSRAVTLDELAAAAKAGGELPWCDPVELLGFPVVELTPQMERDVACGRRLSGEVAGGEGSRVSCVSGRRLMAVYEQAAGGLRPATVIGGGVAGVA